MSADSETGVSCILQDVVLVWECEADLATWNIRHEARSTGMMSVSPDMMNAQSAFSAWNDAVSGQVQRSARVGWIFTTLVMTALLSWCAPPAGPLIFQGSPHALLHLGLYSLISWASLLYG